LVRAALLVALTIGVAGAQAPRDNTRDANGKEGAAVEPTKQLADQQARLADKYRRMEELLFKMADFEATSHPRRAALLKQAYKQSKDRLTYSQLAAIVKLLGAGQLKRAVDGQQTAEKDLEALLKLLQTENRSDRLKTEAQRIKEYIKELQRLQRLQRSVRGQTEGGGDMQRLADSQQKVADRTGNLAKKIEQDSAKPDARKNPAPAEKQTDGKSSEKPAGARTQGDKPTKSGSGKNPEERKNAAKENANDKKPSGTKRPAKQPGKSSGGAKKKDGKPSQSKGQGKPAPSQNGQQQSQQQAQQQPQQQQNGQQRPKRVREAEQKMREARQRLEEAKRDASVKKQRAAEQKLKEAIAELEEVLRQLREEEMGRMLALLEGRFRKMLEMQLKTYEGTMRLGKIPKDKRTRAVDIRATKLAFDERKITAEADRALTLLLEEGSSIAFPEVVEQMRDDMQEVGARLAETKVDRITQGLEEEIIATLEELIEALQKAQQDMDKKKSRPSRPSRPGEMPLVDILAELKMIRSLQFRVNSRTKRYSRLLDDVEDPVGQATDKDLRQALRKLGERERRLQRITRDIVLGKNK